MYRLHPDAFTRDQLRILQAITAELAPAIKDALILRQAKPARTDCLTGRPNMRSLLARIEGGLSLCRSSRGPLSVMLCDLDDFKAINDHFGHRIRNQVLRRVARTLRRCCRESDYVARVGGDEFVVVSAGLAAESALERQSRIERAITQTCADLCAGRCVSVSAMLSTDWMGSRLRVC